MRQGVRIVLIVFMTHSWEISTSLVLSPQFTTSFTSERPIHLLGSSASIPIYSESPTGLMASYDLWEMVGAWYMSGSLRLQLLTASVQLVGLALCMEHDE